MAQVTMDSKEYLELVDKVRKLERVEQEMLDKVVIHMDQESEWNKCQIHITPVFTPEVEEAIITRVVDELKDKDWMMDYLIKDNRHFLNITGGNLTYNWNEQAEQGEVDLFKNKEFKKAWDAAKKRAEETVAEEEE